MNNAYAALCDNDWQTYGECFVEQICDEIVPTFSAIDNPENYLYPMCVSTATVISVSPTIIDYDTYAEDFDDFQNYTDVEAFLVNVNLSVSSESVAFQNGANLHYIIVGKENGVTKLIVLSAPSYGLLSDVYNENIATEMVWDRYYAAQPTPLISLFSYSDPSASFSTSRPSTIKVRREDKSGNPVESINFQTYCYGVTYAEISGTTRIKAQSEAMKANAVAIKTLAWFRVISPKYAGIGYDVKTQSTAAQADMKYLDSPTTTAELTIYNNYSKVAVDATWNYCMENSKGRLMEVPFLPGDYNSNGSSGGTLYQKGSAYLAENGYTYSAILHYYYDNTTTKTHLSPNGSVLLSTFIPPSINKSVSSSPVTISWGAVSGATYKLYRSASSSFTSPVEVYSGTANGFVDTSVLAGQTYYYRILVTKSASDFAYTAVVIGTRTA